jgi:hypothetical protein
MFEECFQLFRKDCTHNGGNGEALLLSVLEETEDIVADNDAGLAVKLFKDTHYEVCTKNSLSFWGSVVKEEKDNRLEMSKRVSSLRELDSRVK